MQYITPTSGHTLRAPHIEEPVDTFFVEWDSPTIPTAVDGLIWSSGKRWAKVMAKTPRGAIKVARYHHYSGTNHKLLDKEPTD